MLHFHETNEVYLSLLTRSMFTYAFFFFVANVVILYRVFYWSLVDVLTRVVLIGNFKNKFFSHFTFSLVQ
jgi:hypothetical protein